MPEATENPTASGFRWLIPLVVLGAFVVAASLFWFKDSIPTDALTGALTPPPVVIPSAPTAPPATPPAQVLPFVEPTVSQAELDSKPVASLKAQVGTVERQVLGLSASLSRSEASSNALGQSVISIEQRLGELEQSVTATISPEVLLDLQQTVSRLEQSIKGMLTARGEVKKTSTRPPFRLSAVEIWDNQTSAVVLLDGKQRILHEGDFVIGFKVVSIDLKARTLAVFEPSKNKTFTLEVDQ